ncbi:hypothetical protein FK220_019950 [Flavobacteriaceae bacterium TP-CH-4]|uniref:Lipoprotein n=1 Tax=Pelagihabitans pacificus TaxID=2696054 RepID=A0A967AXC2_9FLAO|nr:hypothetical protein [Pelagihabitans pacificus]NHF61629.1 hypothetical protein [Pelagihabitans pacificus]
MKKTLQVLLITSIIIACGDENSKNAERSSEIESQQTDFLWLQISENDSVKFKGFSFRYFNQGKDSVLFAHYVTDLYSSFEDSKNPLFRKQSIQVLDALSKNAKLPDSMYVQAVGEQSGAFIKTGSNFNIYSGFDGNEWSVSIDGKWFSITDFK